MNNSSIGCEEALRHIMSYIDRELPEHERGRVEEHLETCRSCWSRAEFERRLKSQLTEIRSAPVRPQLETRIRQLILGGNRSPEGA